MPIVTVAAVATALAGLGARNLFLLAAAGVLLDLPVQGNLAIAGLGRWRVPAAARAV